MSTVVNEAPPIPSSEPVQKATFAVLFALSFAHLLNDTMQSLLPAIYPMLKDNYQLSFKEIGMITLMFQATASLFQPLVGIYTDKRPQPYSLAFAMVMTFVGLLTLAYANSYYTILFAACLVGFGSSIFHPESSRVARMASGGRHGMAQSLFQVGGNAGTALGPLLAAFIVVPFGQNSLSLFSLAAVLGMFLLFRVGRWYSAYLREHVVSQKKVASPHGLSRTRVAVSVGILLCLIFSKHFYLVSLTNYYTFYLMERFELSQQVSLLYLFVFLASVALGTFVGGPIGDRVGFKVVIWASILGILPFTLILPYVDLFWTCVMTIIIGLVLASAFSAIMVYAQELLPNNVGMVAGLFFGFAFGMAGLGAAVLGFLIDEMGIVYVYKLCSFLPLIGLLTIFLPSFSGVVQPVKR